MQQRTAEDLAPVIKTCNLLFSNGFQVFSILSLLIITATIILLVLSSFKEFQEIDPQTNSTIKLDVLDAGDTFCVAFFTGEYLLRLWSSPNTFEFVKNPMSIIDVVAILPFYLELAFRAIGVDTNFALGDLKRSVTLVRMLRILRLLRVLRVLKVARYSQGFQKHGINPEEELQRVDLAHSLHDNSKHSIFNGYVFSGI